VGASAQSISATELQTAASGDARLLPLCVDLDGTLCHSDTLQESFLSAVRRDWTVLLLAPLWFARGRARLKDEIAARAQLNPVHLPYRRDLVGYLREQSDAGRSIVLATAANVRVAEGVACHLGFFDAVMASDSSTNLKGATKAEALVERFGEGGFAYAGNDQTDLAVWRRSGAAIIVGARSAIARRLPRTLPIERSFPGGAPFGLAALRALRPHQWLKNALVFLPLVAGHALLDLAALGAATLAFIAFSLTASGIYLLNDLADLESDRAHPRKCRRPFASGALPILFGLIFGPLCFLFGSALAFSVSAPCGLLVLCYAVISSLYSSTLKKWPLVDVFTLAGLYASRVLTGSLATGILPSIWLLSFSGFLFLGLAILKRTVELGTLAAELQGFSRRGYVAEDLPTLRMLGVSSSFASSLVLALYVDSHIAQSTYAQPSLLWALVPLVLFWNCRMWLSAGRGFVDDDPIVYAARDWVAWLTFAAAAAVLAAASFATFGAA
jgi:4-hydroxybenzoate polyprenyltransferase